MKTEHAGVLSGVSLIEPDFRLKDHRGEIVCALEEDKLPFPYGAKAVFSKHNFSVSHQNVLRGIHVSNCWKLAYCPHGKLKVAVVNCRREGDDFGQWGMFDIDDENRLMVLVPPMFGLAHLVLSKVAVFYYHWSAPFDGDEQISYHYKSFGVPWPTENPILSDRDRNATLICYNGTAIVPAEQLRRMDEEDRR